MSFFAKGDFKIQASWDQKPPSRNSNSRNNSRDADKNKSLVNAGKNIIAEPTTDILDDQISKRILKDFAEQRTFGSVKIDKKGTSSKEQTNNKMPPKQKTNPISQHDGDLLTTMAARLKNVEMTCKNQREEIKEKTQMIQKLKSQNSFLKGLKQDAKSQYQKLQRIQSENEQLKRKIEEMESYLRRYGLKWVGNKMEGQLNHDKMKKDIKSGYQYRLPSEIDINTILRRVQQLNAGLRAEGMGTEVYQENGVHKFRKSQPLPIGFFANGIAIKGFKFFPYKSKEALQILGDLIDGYFPYVLKRKYPNGVFMKVVDKVAESFNDQSHEESINTFESNENKDFKPPSKEEFLNRLPEKIIKNGKVINIRGQIEKRLNGQGEVGTKELRDENDIYFRQQGATVFKTKQNQRLSSCLINEGDICTIKIRNQIGQVYILHLERENLMKQVYSWMQKVTKQAFVLMSNFPRRAYQITDQQTLEQLGFYPNAMLHIHLQ